MGPASLGRKGKCDQIVTSGSDAHFRPAGGALRANRPPVAGDITAPLDPVLLRAPAQPDQAIPGFTAPVIDMSMGGLAFTDDSVEIPMCRGQLRAHPGGERVRHLDVPVNLRVATDDSRQQGE